MSLTEAKIAEKKALNEYLHLVASNRDMMAFRKLFDHFAPLIRSYSLAREPGANLVADDLAQEVMLKVWEKATYYTPEKASLSTWIFILARNCRIDYLRKNGRYVSEIDPTDIFDSIVDESPGPFQAAHDQKVSTALHKGLELLPNEQTVVLRKVYMEGKSHQQVSDELELPLGTVKSRIRLAVKKLETLVRM